MKPRKASRSRRFGPVDVGQVDRSVMATARKLARRPGMRLRVIDSRTAIVENVSPWERNAP